MKAVSRSVSLIEPLWEAVDAHAPTTPGYDRSGYIRMLVEADLKKAGKLPGDDVTEKRAEILSIAEVIGDDTALQALRQKMRELNPAA